MKKRYLTQWRFASTDTLAWVVGPDVLAVSERVAAETILKDVAWDSPAMVNECIEVRASCHLEDPPQWQTFKLKPKLKMIIQDC